MAKTKRTERVDDDLDEILLVGGMMSNVCFNVGQQNGATIKDQHERSQLKYLQLRWDAAVAALVAKRAKSTAG